MDIQMRVHRVSTHPVEVEVNYNGDVAKAMLPEMEVELMTAGGHHGTHTLHFRSQTDILEARELFHQGDLVTLSYSHATPDGSRMMPQASAMEADTQA